MYFISVHFVANLCCVDLKMTVKLIARFSASYAWLSAWFRINNCFCVGGIISYTSIAEREETSLETLTTMLPN